MSTSFYPSASQRASVLGVKEKELEAVNPEFKFTIKQIRNSPNRNSTRSSSRWFSRTAR